MGARTPSSISVQLSGEETTYSLLVRANE